MSLNRYAKRVDITQSEIVRVLREHRVQVWQINRPCDLLTRYYSNDFKRWLWQPLECKTPYGKAEKAVVDKRQEAQIEFLQTTGTPVVLNGEQALRALGVVP